MKQCTVIVPRLTLTVLQGSTVILDEAQYKLVEQFVTAEAERAISIVAETPEKPRTRKRK